MAAQTGGGTDPAEQAVRKLLYGADGGMLAGLAGGPLASGGRPGTLLLAGGASGAAAAGEAGSATGTRRGPLTDRTVDAYAMLCRGGHWYLVGLDVERDAVRAFRLSRLTSDLEDVGEGSEPPETFRAADHVLAGTVGVGAPSASAVVAFSPEVAWWATAGLAGAEAREPRADGWIEVAVPLADGRELAGLGAAVRSGRRRRGARRRSATRSWPGWRRSVTG